MIEDQLGDDVTLGVGQRVGIGDGEVTQVDANRSAGVAVREAVAVAVLSARPATGLCAPARPEWVR